MSNITWNDVVARGDFVKGSIICEAGGRTFFGPLTGIKNDAVDVHFSLPWLAVLTRTQTNPSLEFAWKYFARSEGLAILKRSSQPLETSDGVVQFSVQQAGGYILIPRWHSRNIKLKDVIDLPTEFQELVVP